MGDFDIKQGSYVLVWEPSLEGLSATVIETLAELSKDGEGF